MLVAVPSDAPGGLDATISAHFGHSWAFTLVSVEDGKIGEVKILNNEGHDHGGCMTPVNFLKDHKADILVAGGMGARPLAGFQKVGIKVYSKEEVSLVKEAVELYMSGKAREFAKAEACSGGGDCGDEHESDDHGHDHHHVVEREPIEGKADIQKDRVVSMHYTLRNKDGEVIDQSPAEQPLRYLHGHANIVPGLEKALLGLEAGAHKVVEVPFAEGYGPRDESQTLEVPREHLPPQAKPGMMVRARQPDGQVVALVIVELNDEKGRLDANHPLAGIDLVFDISIVSVEAAVAEEITHGHVH